MIIIGLAGGIGSGKSTVSAYLRSLGIPVFNASNAAKGVAVKKGSTSLQKIAEHLGVGKHPAQWGNESPLGSGESVS